MDRLGFWGGGSVALGHVGAGFQYPLMDRLGFWGIVERLPYCSCVRFQYPLMDRLGFWGRLEQNGAVHGGVISVSADGSTWFLGG